MPYLMIKVLTIRYLTALLDLNNWAQIISAWSSFYALTLNALSFSLLWFEPSSGYLWESQVLLTDGQVVFPWVLRFLPTFDE